MTDAEILTKVSTKVGIKKALETISKYVPGPVGMVIPMIGEIYFEYKDEKEAQKQIEDIEENIEKVGKELGLSQEEQEEQLKLIEKKISGLAKSVKEEQENAYVEICIIDGFRVFLKETDDLKECHEAILMAMQDMNTLIGQWVWDNFILGETLVFHLKDHACREDIEELIEEIKDVIRDTRDVSWNEVIKKISFF